jgi:PAS domain S-box-containing protein
MSQDASRLGILRRPDRLPPGMSAVVMSEAMLVHSLGEPVVGKSLDGIIRSWNPGAEKLYGYSAAEAIGQPIAMLVPPDRQDELTTIMERLGRGEEIEHLETVRRHKDGHEIRVSLTVTPVRTSSGDVAGAVAITHDITERVRREEMQRLLADTSRLLVVDLDHREMLESVARLTLSGLADWCIVELTDAAGAPTDVAVAHRDPEQVELVRRMRRLYPPTATRPSIQLRVLATGTAELIPDVSEVLLSNIAQNPDHLRMLQELGPRSLIVVPLRVRERTLGTILLANTDSRRRFTPEDLGLADDLARRAALAIENAALYQAEQAARRNAEHATERINRLQAVTAALSKAVTPSSVAEVLVSQGTAAVGADGGFVRLLTADGTQLKLVATRGISKHFVSSYKQLPLTSPLLGAEVFRSGGERYFESADAVRAASPEFAHEHAAIGHEAIAFIPLQLRRRPIGLMALTFATPRTFDADDRELLKALASQAAQAFERARLFEAERQARAAAERAIERTAHLQSLAAALAQAFTPAQVAEVAVRNGVASLHADAGALQLLTENGTMLEVVKGEGSDPALIEGDWRRFSVDLNVPSADALRRLEPVFLESENAIRRRYPEVESQPHALVGKTGFHARAGAHVPLIAGGAPLGVLFLGFTRPRRFSESERSFVLALGRQCAQALERAQLYETELQERSKLSRLLERLHEGVISVDPRGRVEFASSAAVRMLAGAPLREGSPVPETWFRFPLRSFAAGLFETDETAVEAQATSADGERVFDVTGIPPASSDAALVILQDVSERERRRRIEREFVDNAAHELRTPLAAITSAIERLQAGAREVPEKRDRFLGHIQHESMRLNRLASSLLMLARAQTREEEPRREEIALRALIEELVGGLDLKPGTELVLDCPPDLVARSNRDLLEHALLNLASNAARHTEGGRVCIRASVEDDGAVMIEVSDTGSGIPPEELGRLFDRFYRGPTEEGRAGFGLGLPITKEAVEAIGGRVEIDSNLGEGTTARIVLPPADVPVLS